MHKTSVDDALGHKKVITKEDFETLYEKPPINPGQNKQPRGILKDYCEECPDCPDREACNLYGVKP